MVRMSREDERLGMMAALLERLPAAVAYLAGPDHRVEFANDAFVTLVGDRMLLGRTILDALPEVERQAYVDVLDQVLATGEPAAGREAELWVQPADGRPKQVFVDFACEPVRDDNGYVAGLLLHATDVTAHVRDRRRLVDLTSEVDEAHERYRLLFETMLHGVVYHGPDGAVVAANPKAGEILGVDPDAMVGLHPQRGSWDAVREDGSPFPGDEHPAMVALRTGEIVHDVVMGVTHGSTGERRWLRVTAVPDATDAHGTPQRVYAMFRDVTEQRRTASALDERDRLLGRLRDANVLGILLVDSERVLDANEAFLEMLGYTRADFDAGKVDWRALTPPEWEPHAERAIAELRRTGVAKPFEKEYWHADGHRVPALVGAAVVEREPIRWVTFVADLSERQRAEEERVRLLEHAQAARADAASADERLSLLLRASALVAVTRDRDALLRHVIRLVVPALADYAAVFVPDAEGNLHASVGEHHSSDGTALIERLKGYPVSAEHEWGLQAAFKEGRSQLVGDVLTLLDQLPGFDPALTDLARQLDVGSFVAVPLVQAGTTLGVLGLGRTREHPTFQETDVAVAEELARRLILGLTEAETSAREHTVAAMLQRSVLPEVLPRVPGADLSVVYLPATEGVEVGGDWYDAFQLGDGRLGLVLGDVVGHNLASASAMNQVRNALRAYAVDTSDPAVVLARTNAALHQLMPDAMATVCYGVLDAASGVLTYANAGHPPPLLAGPHGPRYLGDTSDVMLGVTRAAAYRSATHRLEAGSALLLYSDGLVEHRKRSLDEGLEALMAAFADGQVVSAAAMCETAQATMLEGPNRADDVCLLAVHLSASPPPS